MTTCHKCGQLETMLDRSDEKLTKLEKSILDLSHPNFKEIDKLRDEILENDSTVLGLKQRIEKLRKALEPFAEAVTIRENGAYTYAGSEAIPEFKYFKAAKQAYEESV